MYLFLRYVTHFCETWTFSKFFIHHSKLQIFWVSVGILGASFLDYVSTSNLYLIINFSSFSFGDLNFSVTIF